MKGQLRFFILFFLLVVLHTYIYIRHRTCIRYASLYNIRHV